ncbi:MAG TPA: DUF192 domain-containing protein [Actinomycetota bacterium]|nr:DUF192 domain-containing protein [Actinomycetota bacterium]
MLCRLSYSSTQPMIATRSTRPAPRRAASALLVAALLTGCGGGAPARPEPRGARIAFRTDRGVVRTGPLWVARTPEERARGLMGVRRLPGDGGMAFLFERPTRGPFWMKDTPLPLSIAFWDRAGRVVAILDMEPCRSDPCPLYRPGVAYVGAVEMRQGWFEEHGVEVGDAVELQLEGT